MTLVVCIGMLYCPAYSQTEEQPSASYELNSISFEGNKAFSKSTLLDVVQSKETPGFISKFFRTISFGLLGSDPEYMQEDTVNEDVTRLENYYRNNSYFQTKISRAIQIDTSGMKCSVTFTITEGSRSYIDSIEYRGFENLPNDIRASLLLEPDLSRGDPYETQMAQAEIVRILTFLTEAGYAQAGYDKEHSGAYHYASTNNFVLIFTFKTGRRFSFGDVTVHVDPPRDDITPELVTRHLELAPGEMYSQKKTIASERSLNRLDLFETVRIEPQLSDSAKSTIIPTDIYVRPRMRNEISPEISASDENNTFNLGIGIGYTNRNFLGDARLLTTSATVRAQSIPQWNIYNVIFKGKGLNDSSVIGAAELQLQLQQPYIFSRNVTGTWTSSISTEKQKDYTLKILRNKIGISNQFATYTYGLVEWTLERVNPDLSSNLITGTSPLPLKLTQQENQKQFNSILTLTLQRDKTNDIFSPTEGFFNSITLEESGLLPHILKLNKDNSPYTQYYKVVLFGRWYQDLSKSRKNILALKAHVGYQEKYGESLNDTIGIPLNRRFFAGGSSSVRGWRARDLGAMPDPLLPFGGNFTMDASMEFRVNHFRGMGKFLWFDMNSVWVVYFADVGNVWGDMTSFHLNDIAAATGFGFRYETSFGPFRIDYGFKFYDPKARGGKQMIFQKRFWGDTFTNGVLHFGIGQSF